MIVVLTFFTVAIGSAGALLGLLATRLSADSRATWLGTAVGCASLTILSERGLIDGRSGASAMTGADLLVPGLVVTLLLVALVDPTPLQGRQVAGAALGVLAVAATAGALGAAFPPSATTLSDLRLPGLGLSAAWAALALTVVVRVLRRREHALAVVAGGIGVLGAVHLGEILVPGFVSDAVPLAPVIRLAAVGLVLGGSLEVIRRALVRLDAARDDREEELRLVAMQLERTAERDHELRTGLAGLAGAARLMDDGELRRASGGAALDALVASEIHRLEDLLRGSAGPSPQRPPALYDVEPVLQGLVALHRAAGTDVRLESDAGLRAVGSPETLAQVMTNVLANAERHAPGSPVRVTGMRWHDRVVIRVRDFGPGVDPGLEEAVLERGVHDASRGGSGLGLSVCRRMLEAEQGSIVIRRRRPTAPGCTVVVELPEPGVDRPVQPVAGPEGASCAAP